ncbi:MarR family winged helix-turn-helix transcriptional regulator [Brevibacterium oceani]|uniref:MarR family winged helix-turn-helix transcriptional regulator n=1 Tax=Brevibacterium oceani TaxID=358099 RepID=UPI0015E6999D|nr:MarR family transcriptional regulator [Brevibacterium oceani]
MTSADGSAPSSSGLRYFSDESEFSDRSRLTAAEIRESTAVMEALHQWREADRLLAEAARRYMELNESDMRAIRMLIHAQKQGILVTPKDVAAWVGISGASTTKLIVRLVDGGHLVRVPHPRDKRTLCIEVTESTALAAREAVGRQHARRFDAAAAMSSEERYAVIRFLEALTEADLPRGVLAAAANTDGDVPSRDVLRKGEP